MSSIRLRCRGGFQRGCEVNGEGDVKEEKSVNVLLQAGLWEEATAAFRRISWLRGREMQR